jgi:hypothetical protein
MTQSFSPALTVAATKAVYELQLSTERAARFVCSEVRNTAFEVAVAAVGVVARPTK